VETPFLYPEQVDRRVGWPLGRAARLARQRRLPFYLLPDGAIRFRWEDLEPLVLRVPSPERRWDSTGSEVRHAE
jgi:hypothetical protein